MFLFVFIFVCFSFREDQSRSADDCDGNVPSGLAPEQVEHVTGSTWLPKRNWEARASKRGVVVYARLDIGTGSG